MEPHALRSLPGRIREAVCLGLALLVAAFGSGCSGAALAPGHAKRALEPAGFAQAVAGQGWEMAVVRASQGSAGHEYSGTKLMPVLLVFRNVGPDQPQVILEDVRGVGVTGECLVYSPEEALRLAAQSTVGRKAASAAKSGAIGAGIGAALGAGAGALAYALGYRDANIVWQGAAAAGAAGAVVGAVTSSTAVDDGALQAIKADLNANVWGEDPIAPGSTRMGYLLFPRNAGIEKVRLVVRTSEGAEVKTLAIAQPESYDPARVRVAQAAAPAAARPPMASPAPSQPPAQPRIEAPTSPVTDDEAPVKPGQGKRPAPIDI